jgi:UDP-N-acetylglucosamine:LPS N-acetylglucosamine transferase
VRWLDTLAVLGPRFAAAARAYYVSQVEHLPAMYEFFFSAMWRHRWYLDAARRGLGAVFGRRMAPHIRAFRPDVIISTYPLGSAGLSWLRRRGQLDVPTGAWVPAFCPHPSWLYRNLDVTYVMHQSAAAVAVRAEPGTPVVVGAPPVRGAFAPADKAPARARLGLRADRFVAALCTGSMAFGPVERAVTAVLAAGPHVQAAVVCGRNAALRDRLSARPEPAGRLRITGWTDDMPEWLAAADVVVTNGGGATALEAVRSCRPVIMFEPIAGHGRANAALMASAGLAQLAPSPAALTTAVRRLATDPAPGARQAAAALAGTGTRRREDDLADLAAVRAP